MTSPVFEPEKCSICNNSFLTSNIESRLRQCSACIENRINNNSKTEVELFDMKVKYDREVSKQSEINSKVERMQSLLKAETEGIFASQKSLSDTENPYPVSQSELHTMWLTGWQTSETKKLANRVLSVIKWASESLLVIEEICRGLENAEIADKISVVREKLADNYKS